MKKQKRFIILIFIIVIIYLIILYVPKNYETDYIINKVKVNEIKKRNGIVFRVISNQHLEDNHISDHDLDYYTDFDYYIYNTDDIDYLIVQLKSIITKLSI